MESFLCKAGLKRWVSLADLIIVNIHLLLKVLNLLFNLGISRCDILFDVQEFELLEKKWN